MGAAFAETLLTWYAAHKRELPWRDVGDPYKIWVSEIILQQTRVRQGHDYYLRFIKAFPRVSDLARAKEDEVLRLWQGLGYYSRARNMRTAAKEIVELGHFPKTYEEIRRMKGVGDYTASAICSLAYNQPYAVVDGNVYRVLSRYFGIHEPTDTSRGKKFFAQLATELLPQGRAADYNQAVMDFGALQCTPTSPDCAACPLGDTCMAKAQGNVGILPIKIRHTKVCERFFVYVMVATPDGFWLHQRGSGDIWQGLYEPPLLEFSHTASFEEVSSHPFVKKLPEGARWKLLCDGMTHVLTHRVIHATAYKVTYDFSLRPPEGFLTAKHGSIDIFPLPRLVERVLSEL